MTDDIDRRIEQAAREVTATADRVREHVARRGPVTGSASSADGLITVTVAPGGAVQRTRLGPTATRMDMDVLAREIVTLAQRATRTASNRLHATVGPTLDPAARRGLDAIGLPETPDDPEDLDRDFGSDEDDDEWSYR